MLAERLLVLTFALMQSEDGESLNALLTERERTLDALSKTEWTPETAAKVAEVMRAERSTLQHFADIRSSAVRELGRRTSERQASSTYGRDRRISRTFDASN